MACENGDQGKKDYKTLVKELKNHRKQCPDALFEDDEKYFSLNKRDLPGISNIPQKDLDERPIEWVRPGVSMSRLWLNIISFLTHLFPTLKGVFSFLRK